MKLIVGLGNPGQKYSKTRHNLGLLVIEQLKKGLGPLFLHPFLNWRLYPKFKAQISEGYYHHQKILLIKPEVYINQTGGPISKIINYYKTQIRIIEDLWVIHDEIDLTLGKGKISKSSRSAGHKGVESIIKTIGSQDFVRFRIGINSPSSKNRNLEDFVLENFTKEEYKIVNLIIKKTIKEIVSALDKGVFPHRYGYK